MIDTFTRCVSNPTGYTCYELSNTYSDWQSSVDGGVIFDYSTGQVMMKPNEVYFKPLIYNVGDIISGVTGCAVVFYTWSGGTHGLMAQSCVQDGFKDPPGPTGDTSRYLAWGTYNAAQAATGGLVITNASGITLGEGLKHTKRMEQSSPARQYVESLTIGGFTDWHLPTIEDSYQMYLQRDLIGGMYFAPANSYLDYWTCCELSFHYAAVRYMDNGSVFNESKTVYGSGDRWICVRAIRTF